MVRGVDDRGGVTEPGLVEGRQNAPDIVVEEGAEPVIGRDRGQTLVGVLEGGFGVGDGILLLDPGVAGMAIRGVLFDRWQAIGGVEVEELVRHDQREMRGDEADEQAPGGVVARAVGHPRFGSGDHRLVIFGVLALARADIGPQHAAGHDHPLVLAPDRAPDHPDALVHHHGDVLGVEPCRVLFGAVVQLADALDGDPGPLQGVAPALRASAVGHGVIPEACLVDVEARRETGAGGDADR